MKKFIIILAVCFAANSGNTQVVVPSILNSNTTRGNVGNLSFEFSLGEMATTTIANNTIVTQGFLQPLVLSSNSPLPVLGLDFQVKRLNKQQVQLDWKTLQEINNKGFSIERKRDIDNNFAALRFLPSKSSNGNSSFPITYQSLDTNAFAGKTFYRLKQEDNDGKFVYSAVRVVSGDAEKMVTLQAWPIPAPKEFSVTAQGIGQDVVLLFDASGRLVKQQSITNGEVVKFTGLMQGAYLLRLRNHPDVTQKIIVQ